MRDIFQLKLARMPEVSFINECCKDQSDLWAFGGNVILKWTCHVF